jgi:hypothetical protein
MKRKRKKLQGWKPRKWDIVARVPPHEIDERNMKEMREKFINAGLKNNIRKGRQDDLAWAVPSLIPVPWSI